MTSSPVCPPGFENKNQPRPSVLMQPEQLVSLIETSLQTNNLMMRVIADLEDRNEFLFKEIVRQNRVIAVVCDQQAVLARTCESMARNTNTDPNRQFNEATPKPTGFSFGAPVRFPPPASAAFGGVQQQAGFSFGFAASRQQPYPPTG